MYKNLFYYVFNYFFFLEQIDRIESCINLWVNEPSDLEYVFSYSSQNTVIPFYNDYFDEYDSNTKAKNKFVCIRVSQSFYKMLCDVSETLSISVTQYIINCSMNPMYTEICCVSENKDILILARNIENNIRLIFLFFLLINKKNFLD